MNHSGKRMKPEAIHLTKIQLIETFDEFESATDFEGFEALHNIVLDIDNKLLCSGVQTEAKQMYDELWRSFEMFQQNVNKVTLNVKRKKNHAFTAKDFAWHGKQ